MKDITLESLIQEQESRINILKYKCLLNNIGI